MTKLKRVLAIVLSLVFVLTIIPTISAVSETKAAVTFEITSPSNNQLVAAGYIDIKWESATTSEVKDYEVYIDDTLVKTTTDTAYEYYTTKVKAFTTYVKVNYTNGTSEQTEKITFGVSKKGLGLAPDMGANLNLRDMGVAWYYNWGTGPSSGQQYKYVEYVPVVWKETDANNFRNRVNAFKNQGYKYVLTYNEPDLQNQCNMSVDAVYNAWQGIDDVTGIKISSPVTAQWPKNSSGWFQAFMNKIDVNNDHDVDFISVHCYPDNYGGAGMAEWFLEEVVDWTWQKYKKPIWITEFSTTGQYITATGGNGTKEFWQAVMPELDKREYVERYAAFGFNDSRTGLWAYSTGTLTPGGEVYKSQGNPANFTPQYPVETFTFKENTRRTLLDDAVSVNGVTCEDYIKSEEVSISASSEINASSKAQNIIDESISSRWESIHNVDPQYVIVDLGTIRNIKQVSIVWEAASASAYTIEFSNDGTNYKTVAKIEGGSNNQNRNDTVILKEMASGRYVKINGTARSTAYGYSIYDMAIYGTTNVDSKNNIKVGKTKIKQATKKLTLSKAKISIKRLKGVKKYQIQISKKNRFNKKNILIKKTVKRVKFVLTNKKLKNRKKLYIRARAIKVVNGKKYYGKWSNKKKIKIKK